MPERILITGSSRGIGFRAAQMLVDQGNEVVMHARDSYRKGLIESQVPGAVAVLVGDFTSMHAIKELAEAARRLGPFDVVIHNAGVGAGETRTNEFTRDNVSEAFSVNVMAPYILGFIMGKPRKRVLIMSSDCHTEGDGSLIDATETTSYATTKLYAVLLAKCFARRWPQVQCLSLYPGWVRTRMGGQTAPVSVDAAAKNVAEWAMEKGPLVDVRSGAFVTCIGEASPHDVAEDNHKQDDLYSILEKVTGLWPI